jgi:hypothetical protein
VNPDKVFVYQAKTIIYGAIAASHNRVSEVYVLVAGLGSIFRGKGIRNWVLLSIVETQYKLAFKRSRKVIFQNNDDRDNLLKRNLLKKSQSEVINGSGVNLDRFQPLLYLARRHFCYWSPNRDKGIMEYLEACKILKMKYSTSGVC